MRVVNLRARAGVVFALGFLCAGIGVEAGDVVKDAPVVVPRLEGGKPNLMLERSMAFVGRLEKESVKEGLKNLSEVEPFYWPGVPGDGVRVWKGVKRREEADVRDVKMIAGNRRVLKLVQELKGMEPEKAGELVGEALDQALAAYAAEYEKVVEKRKEFESRLEDKEAVGGGMSFVISDAKGKPPTLLGLRYQVLSLVLIAGNLSLAEARGSVMRAAAYGEGQYVDLTQRGKGELAMVTREDLLERAGLYSRYVMGTGMAGVRWEKKWPESVKKETMRLTRYNAPVTVGDSWFMGRADFSKGDLEVFYLSGLTDEILREMIQTADPDGNV